MGTLETIIYQSGLKIPVFIVIIDIIYLLSDFVFRMNWIIKDYLSNDQDCIGL